MLSSFEARRARLGSGVVRLSDRIFGLSIDETRVRASRRGAHGTDRSHQQLVLAEKYLKSYSGSTDNVLVLNLGPPQADVSFHDIFNHHVIELPEAHHEKPPGLDVLPLDVLFTLCSCIHSWLKISKSNVVLLHARSSTGTGLDTLKFVAGCFLAFSGDHEAIAVNGSSGGEREQKVKSKWRDSNLLPKHGAEKNGFSHVMHQVGLPMHAEKGGPAQHRYAHYFLSILYAPVLPSKQVTALVMKKVAFGGLDDTIKNLKSLRGVHQRMHQYLATPVLMVYQRGVEKWKGVAKYKEGESVEFQVDMPVAGDVVLGLWFIKDHKKAGEAPLVAFAFHAAFMNPGVVRLSAPRLNIDNSSITGGNQEGIFMELTLGDSDVLVEDVVADTAEGGSIHDLRETWERAHGGSERAEPESLISTASDTPSHRENQAPECATPSSNTQPPPDLKTGQEMENSDPPPPSTSPRNTDSKETEPKPEANTAQDGKEDTAQGSDVDQKSGEGCEEEPGGSKQADKQLRPLDTNKDKDKDTDDDAPSTPSTTETGLNRCGSKELGECGDSSVEVKSADKPKEAPKAPPPPPGKKKGPPKPPPPPPGKRGPPPPPAMGKKGGDRKLSKLRSFYWTKTPRQTGTIWSELSDNISLPPKINTMLETLFCNDSQKKPKAAKKQEAVQKPPQQPATKNSTQVVSAGRATNVSIMMNRFRKFPGGVEGLCKAVLTGEGVTMEDISLIGQIGPKDEEVKAFKDYEGNHDDLAKAEKVLLGMCRVPRLRVKAQCRVIVEQWDYNFDRAEGMLHGIKVACQDIKESQRLRKVLEAVLTVGNAMNRGTNRGNAGGCRIESLLRLSDTKVTANGGKEGQSSRAGFTPTAITQAVSNLSRQDGQGVEDQIVTLLDFIALVVHNSQTVKDYQAATFLHSELESLVVAGGYLDGSVNEQLEEIQMGFETLEGELMAMTGKTWAKLEELTVEEAAEVKLKGVGAFPGEERQFAMFLFNFLKEAGPRRLQLRQEGSISEQHLQSVGLWLGEPENVNPRTTTNNLLTFLKAFDSAYGRLSPYLQWE